MAATMMNASGTINVNANGDIFIVPNSPTKISSLYSENDKKRFAKIAEDNNISFNENEF